MSLVYITGISGSGKSSICRELQKRGLTAFDSDEIDLNHWYTKSGDIVEQPVDISRIPNWHKDHVWRMSSPEVAGLSDQAKHKTMYLFGTTSNIDEEAALFSHIVFLDIDRETMTQRLKLRDTNPFGKSQAELKAIHSWFDSSRKDIEKYNPLVIDATKSIPRVADDIISISQKPVAYLLCGLPGSGKTTYANNLVNDEGVVKLSIDEDVISNHGVAGIDYPKREHQERKKVTIGKIKTQIKEYLADRKSVVLDFGVPKRKDRLAFRDLIESSGGVCSLIYFKVGKDELLKRLESRAKAEGQNAVEITSTMLEERIASFENPKGEGEKLAYKSSGAYG